MKRITITLTEDQVRAVIDSLESRIEWRDEDGKGHSSEFIAFTKRLKADINADLQKQRVS